MHVGSPIVVVDDVVGSYAMAPAIDDTVQKLTLWLAAEHWG